jgi:hypothetical protein
MIVCAVVLTFCDRQLGLGSNMTIDTITIPTEVVFSRSASGGRSGRCVGIAAGALRNLVCVNFVIADGRFVQVAT